ncbi:ATP-binding protein [Sandaracinobacteroides saxicola]|uniref:ATP-binding protein n=1 Tax=Sandaracinobacteroides saxicola TaxID=2759707 RepID=A0A7G5IFC4_9SPHN|nr:ATP-binding protein [Sandaracinobacteroides saxicola]QMW22066.1 ATP-binding protein [Sandaracinobacteroides saxicola]
MIFKRGKDGETRGVSFLERMRGADTATTVPDLPGFATNATDDFADGQGVRSLSRARLAISETLGASQPVTQRDRFAGRRDTLAELIAAIEQQRAHVVIYGERGIGKTSLVHVFAETARDARYLVLYGSCGVEARFDEMFRSFAARIPLLYHRNVSPTADEAEHNRSFETLLPEGPAGPREFADIFVDLVGTRVVLILDEYDRVADASFRRDIAELIKNLSDRAARVQLILTGVASNLDELIGFTPSIRRNIIGLPVAPMAAGEMTDLLAMGEKATGLAYADSARAMIVTMAGGSPYITRLLGSRAAHAALDARVATVTDAHVRAATESTLNEWNAGLPRRVQAMLTRPEVRAAWPTLIAAARASGSPDGWFGADEVAAEAGDIDTAPAVERTLAGFLSPLDLFETRQDAQSGARFRFRYQGVAQLLNLSAAMARLSA